MNLGQYRTLPGGRLTSPTAVNIDAGFLFQYGPQTSPDVTTMGTDARNGHGDGSGCHDPEPVLGDQHPQTGQGVTLADLQTYVLGGLLFGSMAE